MNEATIHRAERRAKAIDLLGGECVECGSTDRLEFDHIKNDREDYKHMLGHLLGSCTWKRIVEELKKCQLLCHACHLIKSHVERGHLIGANVIHGIAKSYYSKKCRCVACKEAWATYNKQYRITRGVTP